ncbi:MAG: ABC transporter permease [Firmicutes bacterium]|nr:ABC transporter permease [Bacillota bacterium]
MNLGLLLTMAFWQMLCLATVRMSVPILLSAVGGVYSERSGVVNLGLEGTMLAGCLAGVLGSHYLGSPWLGMMAAIVAGLVTALVFAFVTVTLAVNQVLAGTALNFLCTGLTGFFFRAIFGITTSPVKVPAFKVMPVPLLSGIPFAGPVFFTHVPLVYIAYLILPVAQFVLYRTRLGLKIRAAGEHPRALDTVGVNVFAVRYLCLLVCGALSAMGGAVLSLGELNMFAEEMTAGRGFMAMAAVVLGKWTPFGALGAAILFGFAEAIQLRVQALGFRIPPEFPLMLPYVLTMVTLAGLIGRASAPAAGGRPYVKGEK